MSNSTSHRVSTASSTALLAGVSALLLAGSLLAEEPAAPEADEWEQLLRESEELLDWSSDPLEDLDLDPFPTTFVWSAGLKAGIGGSDNFLKRVNPVSSTYALIEGDAFLNLVLEDSSFTALFYAEGITYERDTEVRTESTAFLHTNYTRFTGSSAWGANLDLFYGDQVYDASLILTSQPVGESFRQVRPQLDLFREWLPGERDRLRLQAGLSRSLFEDADNDYWRPSLEFSWERSLNPTFTGTSTLSLYREFHDSRQTRLPSGLTGDDPRDLEVNGLELEQAVEWDPRFAPALAFNGRFRVALEDSLGGSYEDAIRWTASLGSTWKGSLADASLSLLWQNIRYDQRQAGFFDERPLRQIYRSLHLEIEKTLPGGFSAAIRADWSDFASRDPDEVFTEKRIEAVLGWAY
jgi:hypothetical protein